MSFFKICSTVQKKKDSNENKINWNELTDLGQLSEIGFPDENPFSNTVRCSVSRMALKQFENEFNSSDRDCIFRDLIAHRDISSAVVWSDASIATIDIN
jgi:hypothetical protein